MTPYLIQRAKFSKEKNESTGLDKLLNFEYMGSAEFEWGALPKALDSIRGKISKYVIANITIEDKDITIFVNKDVTPLQLAKYMDDLAYRVSYLKEPSGFDYYIKQKDVGSFVNKPDFWWDIKNDIMFWKKNKDFESEFSELFIQK